MGVQSTDSLFKKSGRVLCYGELLLRMCPDLDGTWLKENKLPFYVGGAEANVATALALWGLSTSYLTALPENSVSEQILEHLQGRKIDTSPILKQGNRIGIYYLHKGKDLKNTGVIYDRAGSSFSELKAGTINWEEVFKGISWFHFSAICPAINQDAAEVCKEALQFASQNNICISIDLNYRAKLWKYGHAPSEVMPSLAKYCTLIMGNIWAAEKMLNISLGDVRSNGRKESYLDQAKITSEQILEEFPFCKAVANTFRFDEGEAGINYYTTLFINGQLHASQEYRADNIVDKVGSGDCFMAGLIYGFYKGMEPQEIVEFATAAAFKKLFIEGDATDTSIEEVLKTIKK